jgi:DNA mismatch repair protein MutS
MISILYPDDGEHAGEVDEPAFFADLNLDQVVDAITAPYEEYDLKPFFYAPLRDAAAIRYRHEALHDLERPEVLDAVRSFARGMHEMRARLPQADKHYYRRQRQRFFLDSVEIYCETVASLVRDLGALKLRSRALLDLRDYVERYIESEAYAGLAADVKEVKEALAGVRYEIHIKGSRVTVSGYEERLDLSAEVERTFEKFRRGAVKDYRVGFRSYAEMNHVEAQILDGVAQAHPDPFAELDRFCDLHAEFTDTRIERFDHEVHFYVSYLDYVESLRSRGLRFCYPRVSADSKEIEARDAFDLALAAKLAEENMSVVCNDFHLAGPERILVVTGPNQGGKTTFSRMFGQLHYLASLGLLVPAADAQLFLADRLYTHFEREEALETLRGRLEDELVRIHEILEHATGDSILVMNESFTSTTLEDSLRIGTEVLREIIDLDLICVCVTFVDELASLGARTVSMMSMVEPDDLTVRTYKIVRKPADGRAYALALASKHGLTYEQLKRRVAA